MYLFYTVISRLGNYKNGDYDILKKGLQISDSKEGLFIYNKIVIDIGCTN